MTFKQWVLDLFEDERGAVSIKPVIAFIGTLFLCVTMTINSIFPTEFQPTDALIDAVLFITIVGMGGDTVDKFSFKWNKKNTENQNPE